MILGGKIGNLLSFAMTNDTDLPVNWAEILAAADDKSEFPSIMVTPETIAVMSLVDCADQLEAMNQFPMRLALAAKSAHLALQAALTAALAGTANIGAHDDKLAARHLAYLEDRGEGGVERPTSDRVMSFPDLLAKATAGPLPWGDAIQLSTDDALLLDRLARIRHDIEHPKQQIHAIEMAYVFEPLPVAANLVATLIGTVFHHIDRDERQALEHARDRIIAYCLARSTEEEPRSAQASD
ncbi:hypothetical protein CLG96_05850 [Sphingomonas oleivorans]|uniref:Uncharacterized protein n=1 Tax=Sphingomonas oleivorans TaxID=1735121 RepID=A0A2T5FZG1_9SPHN|nr:hypothetical protein [Sphingomonas oleivorans]PTQ12090.1 hypothetical protein CLG96_05850 [Sphingomonas oleivorans]